MAVTYPPDVRHELELLEDHVDGGLVDEADADAIRSFASHDVARTDTSERTVQLHLTSLRTTTRRSLKWSGKPNVEILQEHHPELLEELRDVVCGDLDG